MYYYYYHSQKYPDDVIVYVEEVNKEENYVIIDFLDTDQHRKFTALLNLETQIDKTSMVVIRNYYPRKRIQENTAYSIKKNILLELRNLITEYDEESNLFQYQIDLNEITVDFFSTSVSIGDIEKPNTNFNINSYKNLNFSFKGKLQFKIRNVGLANWNEVIIDDKVVIVYDAGAPTFASKRAVRDIIANKIEEYSESNPVLFLSHWDKDHYHALIEMTDTEIKCFSKFIYIDRAITNSTSLLLDRFISALGYNNVIRISNVPRITRGGKTPLYLLSEENSQVLIFTSMYHKTRNISGLVLALRTKKSSVIFSGDCFYSQLSENVLPHLNFVSNHNLIVPHHGGQAGKYIYDSTTLNKTNAIISAGKSKHHPSKYYTSFLRDEFTNLRSTKVENCDIIIDL
jgi:hypothetical protein